MHEVSFVCRGYVLAFAILTGFSSVASADLIASFSFDENTGTTANSSVGSVALTLQGAGAGWGTGISGSAVSFNGFGTAVNAISGLGGLSNMSVSFWFNTNHWTSPGSNPVLYSLQNGNFFLQREPSGLVLYPHPGGPVDADGATLPSTGTWHHSAVTYDGATIRSYLNGVLTGTSSRTGAVNADRITLGSQSLNATGFVLDYNGLIDEFQIYNDALSVSEIQNLFNNPGAGSAAVPEPSSLALFGAIALGAVRFRRRKRKMGTDFPIH